MIYLNLRMSDCSLVWKGVADSYTKFIFEHPLTLLDMLGNIKNNTFKVLRTRFEDFNYY